MEKTLN